MLSGMELRSQVQYYNSAYMKYQYCWIRQIANLSDLLSFLEDFFSP
jgi:hypothetical protein